MLREELLRSKKDEIARCLLSRKRKLSELYFATVGYAGATETILADSLYQQKEQAFLDANDLAKGHCFNEATLPSPPNYAAILPEERKDAPSKAPIDFTPAIQDAVTPINPLSAGERVSPQAIPHTVADTQQQQTVAVAQAPKAKPPQPVIERLDRDTVPQTASAISPEGSQGLDTLTPMAHTDRSPKLDHKVTTIVPETPLSNQSQDSPASDQVKPVRPRSVSPVRPATSPAKKHYIHPASVPVPTQITEQPLSPISSAEPCSNNTPAPATTSPATSPAEETTRAEDGASSSPQHEVPKVSHPSFIPSTPDEQLRLEEAQSLQQQSALAASQHRASVADDSPPKEVIGKDIGKDIGDGISSVSAMPKDLQMEPKELATLLARPETKKQDTVPTEDHDTQARPQPEAVPPEGETNTKEIPLVLPATKKPSPPAPSPPERMTTRVSSGAIRHKSVSEILGEAPKPPASQSGKGSTTEKPGDLRKAGAEPSPYSAKMRFKDRKAREKERSKLSTVVFPKQQQQIHQDKGDSMDLVRQQSGDIVRLNEEQDYLFTLFQNKAYAPPRGTSLSTLLGSAHKTLSTNNHLLDYQEQMDCRILRRIYDLQNANRWPLRQLKRSAEPPRQGTHWDVLLDHMKWMRTDFREERKWKLAAAKSCADWCAEYVHSDPDYQSLLRVQSSIPSHKSHAKAEPKDIMLIAPEEVGDETLGISHPTPDLVPSTEEDSVSDGFMDEPRHDLRDTVAPAAIFSLGSDEFTFSLDMTPAAQKLLDELPVYAPLKIAPNTNLPTFKEPLDSSWKTEILPVSKFARGKISFHEDEPPRKRSRYDYSQYQADSEHGVLDLPPEETNVALFQPENKHIRDRIHPAQPFRPPTEYPMPSIGFLESRQSSQWTYAEDEELRSLVEEYSYNWSLISSCLTPASQFTSGAERRTPWECFERWAGIEGLPSDMSKTPYFRAYHQRIDTAQRNVMAQQQAAAQQQQQQQQQQGNNNNNNPQSLPLIRRRGTQPVRVDRRRSSKHLALLDAMRKLAKKRETILQKQQHASQLASLRKANEANQPKPPISSPAEFSRLKHERELKLQERQEQYRQQMIAQQRANIAAQRAGQMPNQQQMVNSAGRTPNGMPHNSGTPAVAGNTPNSAPNGMPNGIPNGMPNGMPNSIAPAIGVNQARPHVQGMQGSGGPVNNQMQPNPMAMKMMPQSGMQQSNGVRSNMPMQTSPDNARVIREANRLQEQQRLLQSRQQQQQQQTPQPQATQQLTQQPQPQPQQPQQQFHNQPQFVPQGSNSPNMNMTGVNSTPNNPAMMAALQASSGMQSPSFHNAATQGVSTPSPRMAQPNLLSSGVVPTISSIQNQIQRSNPNMPIEQVNKLATDRLHQYQQQRMSQVAMSAAAGNIGNVQANYQVSHDGNFQNPPPNMNGGPGMQVPQAQGYSPMMRVPQPTQQNRVGVASSPAMGGAVPQQSRSATPQTQRSGSVQTGPAPGSGKSPNPPQAQPAGT